MDNDELLKINNLTMKFPGVIALDNISLVIKKSEVHCLLGENGAGKSTLMNCIIGMCTPTKGDIYFNGRRLEQNNVRKALHAGISMIHQELSLVNEKTVMENIWLGREPKNKLGFIDHQKMYELSLELMTQIEQEIDPRELIKNLSIAKMQMIEIAKAISYNAKLIIMDEPSSSLAEREIDQLYRIIRQLKSTGVSIIFISHKLNEIKTICDRITILRDGQFIETRSVSEVTTKEMINLMVGRDISQVYPQKNKQIGEIKLAIEDFSDGKNFIDVSFNLRKGEILGFSGLVGAGRSEVMEALFGCRKYKQGQVYIDQKKVTIKSPHQAIDNKLAFLTEDRRKTGIFPMLSVGFNLLSGCLPLYENRFKILKPKLIEKDIAKNITSFRVKTPSTKEEIKNLSGGNQQKVLIAKWMLTNPDILILDEPTRGIDVGAKTEIYRIISRMAQSGKSIIMISSELPEIIGMSDRVVVMHEGEVTGILNNKNLTQAELLMYANGERNDFKKEAQGL